MSESKADQVEIREVDGQTLRKLVDYIYTAEIEVTEDNVQVEEKCVLHCSLLVFLYFFRTISVKQVSVLHIASTVSTPFNHTTFIFQGV